MRRRGRLAGVCAAAALVVTACSSSHASPGSSPTTSAPAGVPTGASTIHWVACTGSAGPSGYQCATVMVPRNPADPSSAKIAMAVDRHPATGRKIGSIVTNPGGPGASGVDSLPEFVQEMPSSLLARFDIVGFDPPGVDRSAPITCLNSSGLQEYFGAPPAPTTPAGFQSLVATDRTFAAGCEAESGAELPYVSTADAARDMDVLRAALGDAKLTYLGFSYGTLLGATYAELFPTHIRAMVLDGALDPALPVVTQLDEQSTSLWSELQQFFTYCSSNASCGWQPSGGPLAAYEALVAKVTATPLTADGTTRTVGPAELLYGTAVTLYSPNSWNDLGEALQAASTGDGTDMLELFDDYTGRNPNGTYSNLFEANAAVNCLDEPAPSLATLQADAAHAAAVAPVFGVANLYSEAQCTVWPVPATGKVGPITAPGSPPIVVVGSTGDPVTPYAWAKALASQLSHGFLLTRSGDGHTAYQFSACIRTWVDRYLTTLALPPAGTDCPSN